MMEPVTRKDYMYSCSHRLVKPSSGNLDSDLDLIQKKILVAKIKAHLSWFGNSCMWSKGNFLLGLFRICDPGTLHNFVVSYLPSKFVDFICTLPLKIAKMIISYLDENSTKQVSLVCKNWYKISSDIRMEKAMEIKSAKITEDIDVNFVQLTTLPYDARDGTVKYATVVERNCFCGKYYWRELQKLPTKRLSVHYNGGKYAVSGSYDRKARIYDVETGEMKKILQGHCGSIKAVYVSTEFDCAFTAGFDPTIRCWSLSTGQCLRAMSGHIGSVTCMTGLDRYLVTGARDRTVRIWDMATGACKHFIRKKRGYALCIAAHGSTIVFGTIDGEIRIWSIDLKSYRNIKVNAHVGPVSCVDVNSWHVASGGYDEKVYIYDKKTMSVAFTLEHPDERVLSIKFGFLRLMTGSSNGRFRVWNTRDGEQLRCITLDQSGYGIRSFAFKEADFLTYSTTFEVGFVEFDAPPTPTKHGEQGGVGQLTEKLEAKAQKAHQWASEASGSEKHSDGLNVNSSESGKFDFELNDSNAKKVRPTSARSWKSSSTREKEFFGGIYGYSNRLSRTEVAVNPQYKSFPLRAWEPKKANDEDDHTIVPKLRTSIPRPKSAQPARQKRPSSACSTKSVKSLAGLETMSLGTLGGHPDFRSQLGHLRSSEVDRKASGEKKVLVKQFEANSKLKNRRYDYINLEEFGLKKAPAYLHSRSNSFNEIPQLEEQEPKNKYLDQMIGTKVSPDYQRSPLGLGQERPKSETGQAPNKSLSKSKRPSSAMPANQFKRGTCKRKGSRPTSAVVSRSNSLSGDVSGVMQNRPSSAIMRRRKSARPSSPGSNGNNGMKATKAASQSNRAPSSASSARVDISWDISLKQSHYPRSTPVRPQSAVIDGRTTIPMKKSNAQYSRVKPLKTDGKSGTRPSSAPPSKKVVSFIE
eukprot:Nk52_evm74s745 gene=Nk52_evmTU74s745